MIGIIPHVILLLCGGNYSLTVKEYPVFEPNDYFFEHYWDEKSGEDKGETYARIMRVIMAESFNFKLTDLSVADK